MTRKENRRGSDDPFQKLREMSEDGVHQDIDIEILRRRIIEHNARLDKPLGSSGKQKRRQGSRSFFNISPSNLALGIGVVALAIGVALGRDSLPSSTQAATVTAVTTEGALPTANVGGGPPSEASTAAPEATSTPEPTADTAFESFMASHTPQKESEDGSVKWYTVSVEQAGGRQMQIVLVALSDSTWIMPVPGHDQILNSNYDHPSHKRIWGDGSFSNLERPRDMAGRFQTHQWFGHGRYLTVGDYFARDINEGFPLGCYANELIPGQQILPNIQAMCLMIDHNNIAHLGAFDGETLNRDAKFALGMGPMSIYPDPQGNVHVTNLTDTDFYAPPQAYYGMDYQRQIYVRRIGRAMVGIVYDKNGKQFVFLASSDPSSQGENGVTGPEMAYYLHDQLNVREASILDGGSQSSFYDITDSNNPANYGNAPFPSGILIATK